MAKRFFETKIWTQNKWFRKLPLKTKLFWFYLLGNCDSVGVWNEDFELVSFIIGEDISRQEVYTDLKDRIKILSENKIWIRDFCAFQYGELNEANMTNKPHQSYIKLLKGHSLWEDYEYSIKSHKEKEKDKVREKDKAKDKETGFAEKAHFDSYIPEYDNDEID